jgi:hypothetical protein
MNPEEEAVEKTEEQAMEESEEDSVEETEKDGMEETEEEGMEDSEEETEEEATEEEEDSMMIGHIWENKTKSLKGTIIRMMKLKKVRLSRWLGAIKMIRVIMKINRLQDGDGQHHQQRIIWVRQRKLLLLQTKRKGIQLLTRKNLKKILISITGAIPISRRKSRASTSLLSNGAVNKKTSVKEEVILRQLEAEEADKDPHLIQLWKKRRKKTISHCGDMTLLR